MHWGVFGHTCVSLIGAVGDKESCQLFMVQMEPDDAEVCMRPAINFLRYIDDMSSPFGCMSSHSI